MGKRGTVAVLVAGIAFALGCEDHTTAVVHNSDPRLYSRPNTYVQPSLSAGMHRFVWHTTEIIAYVPETALARPLIPLNLMLHSSYRDAEQLVRSQREFADSAGVVIVAPYAQSGTWDVVNTTFGPDVLGIDRALAWVFDRLPVNPQRIAVTGFSDGASYALAIGRANGDMFTKVVAYSPGFLAPVVHRGRPSIVVSHGTHDEELPYERTRDGLIPELKKEGYDVDFRTFDGKHEVLLPLAEEVIKDLGRTDR